MFLFVSMVVFVIVSVFVFMVFVFMLAFVYVFVFVIGVYYSVCTFLTLPNLLFYLHMRHRKNINMSRKITCLSYIFRERVTFEFPSKRFWLRHGHHAARVATWCNRELDSFSTIIE